MATMPSAPAGARIVGLDAWRVALMLAGFLLHGALWQPPQPLFGFVQVTSHAFRMGTLFAISGYLCGLSMRRYPARRWLARRLAQIGLPVLFGWGLICPAIWMLARWYPGAPTPLLFDWHHIWFMVALLCYAPVAIVVHACDRRYDLVRRFARAYVERGPRFPMLLVVATTSFVLMGWTELLITAWTPARLVPMLSQLPNIAGYLPNYLLGLAVARSAVLANAVAYSARCALAVVTAAVALLAIGFAMSAIAGPELQAQCDKLMMTLSAALCPPAVFALLFRSAIRVRRIPTFVRRLCGASLTMYLLHLPLLLIANAVLSPAGWHPYVQYATAISIVAALSYAVHRWIVAPVPLLSLIVNGDIDRWSNRAGRVGGAVVPPLLTAG